MQILLTGVVEIICSKKKPDWYNRDQPGGLYGQNLQLCEKAVFYGHDGPCGNILPQHTRPSHNFLGRSSVH
jgi:hypothetical protein